MDRGGYRGRGSFGMNGRGRGRGMMRPGGFGNGPMNGGMMRGRGRGGPDLRRGPPRMGMNPGMNRGSGRGRFPSGPRYSSEGNGYYQNQTQAENPPAAPVQQPEAVTTEKPITPVTQSTNNVQVVTTGQTPTTPAPQQPQAAPVQTNPTINSSRGTYTPRGRGSFGSRGGFMGRGRGGYQGQGGPPRQQFDTRQPSNLTPASTNTGYNPIKRGGYQGPPGAKRGRYDQGPGGYAGSRSMAPQNQISSMPPQQHHQSSYNNVPPHGGSYQDHSSQYVDQYQNSGYNSMPQQSGYTSNGYGQSYGHSAAPVTYDTQTSYDHTANSGYTDYNATSYQTHDTRYAGYTQDYRQPYGSSADYGQVAQDSTSYSTGAYDRGSYGNYDSYSQGYNGQSGYY
ncbi:CLUMA_CG011214, isoform A [Clunio marinus]|uniref:CLUMA_CG011214, isoform A n=1 Tax=Clunio marinus TaxID=568069 RepID=A0A1J1IFP2_9DIPT|nr:CLUMA_CG011214, isoform A [Clunio marinus]